MDQKTNNSSLHQRNIQDLIFGGTFLLFCVVVIAAILYSDSWWGVMDDGNNLAIATSFWNQPSIHSFVNLVKSEMDACGRFRPLYQIWVISVYHIFRSFPVGLYACMALFGLATLLIWGKIIDKIFPVPASHSFNLFVYPLSFFIFTPFWNNFMYISVLEKFVYFFSTFSFYFYIKAYKKNKWVYIVISFIFMILGLLGKETGVTLAIVFFVYALLDYLLFRKNKKLSLISFTGSFSIIMIYYFLIRSVWSGSYSCLYKNNLNSSRIFESVFSAPLVIKGLLILSFVFCLAGAAFIVRKKERLIYQEFLLFPLSLGAYLLILAPWGFSNYLLAPIAPLVMLTLYPLYMFISARSAWMRKTAQGILICCIFLVLFLIIIPRIYKMGDTKKIVSAIVSMREGHPLSRFFMAPPFEETANMIRIYTDGDIVYLKTGLLNSDMLKDGAMNYLIFEDRCISVTLDNAIAEEEVYGNKTWKIFSLKKTMVKNLTFKPRFKNNFLQYIKDRVKKLR